jgi:hypothetical protein
VKKVAVVMVMGLAVLAAAASTVARAAVQMPIGFYDDASFRWSPDRAQNLQLAAADGASVIHTTANWAVIAPTKPKNQASGDDPAYRLNDLDDLVNQATLQGLRVMIDIVGTPKWANGGKTPNYLPTSTSTLQTFSKMLAARYNGRSGHGTVSLWSVWNEPNLGLFLMPQFSGTKIVGPANYAKLFKAAYAGIKSGNSLAQVAIGETSPRGRDKPVKGVSDSVAPATFAKLLAQQPGLKFDAWAHHPYPVPTNLPPTQKVRYPNVTFSTMPQFEKDLKTWFKRPVPIWITEYGHETKPGDPHGVTYSKQAAYAKQALTIAKKDPNVQMFIWFTLRDSAANPWQSGLLQPSGIPKPSYSAFGSLARLIDGLTISVPGGKAAPKVKLFFPQLYYYQGTGGSAGMTWKVSQGATVVAVAQPVVTFAADGSLSITLTGFTPAKGKTYNLTVVANEVNGHNETQTATLQGT